MGWSSGTSFHARSHFCPYRSPDIGAHVTMQAHWCPLVPSWSGRSTLLVSLRRAEEEAWGRRSLGTQKLGRGSLDNARRESAGDKRERKWEVGGRMEDWRGRRDEKTRRKKYLCISVHHQCASVHQCIFCILPFRGARARQALFL